MDWHGVPDDVEGNMNVEVWHELVEEKKDLAGLDIPEYDPKEPAPAVNTVWPSSSESGEFIDFHSEVRTTKGYEPISCLHTNPHYRI